VPARFAYAPGGVLTIEDNLAKLSNSRSYNRGLLEKKAFEMYYIADGEQFYVKLKIQNRNGKDVLKCLSFHEDDFS